jgi:hypothetical protein
MDEAPYSIDIPPLVGNTYSSFLLYVATPDAPVSLTDVSLTSTYSLTDVFGCTDSAASNYNEDATIDDGSCEYGIQIDLPVTFEESTINYTMSDFGNNISSLIVDPFDSDNHVVKVIKTYLAPTWAGTTIGTPAGFATDIPLTLTDSKMTVRVWSPEAGTPIRLKVEDSDDPTHTCETETNTTLAGEWEVLEFDFLNQAPGTELLSIGLGWGWTYNMASIFFNFGSEGSLIDGETYYFDDVMFGENISIIDDLDNIFKVYPNPASTHISFVNVPLDYSYVIYNSIGRIVMSGNNLRSIDISSLLSGNYYVEFSGSDKVQWANFIKL